MDTKNNSHNFKFDYPEFVDNFLNNPVIKEELKTNKNICENKKIIALQSKIKDCYDKRKNMDSVKGFTIAQIIIGAMSGIGLVGAFAFPINTLTSGVFGLVCIASLTTFFGVTIGKGVKDIKKGGKGYLKKLFKIEDKQIELKSELVNEICACSEKCNEIYQYGLKNEYNKQKEKDEKDRIILLDEKTKEYNIDTKKFNKTERLKEYIEKNKFHKKEEESDNIMF